MVCSHLLVGQLLKVMSLPLSLSIAICSDRVAVLFAVGLDEESSVEYGIGPSTGYVLYTTNYVSIFSVSAVNPGK